MIQDSGLIDNIPCLPSLVSYKTPYELCSDSGTWCRMKAEYVSCGPANNSFPSTSSSSSSTSSLGSTRINNISVSHQVMNAHQSCDSLRWSRREPHPPSQQLPPPRRTLRRRTRNRVLQGSAVLYQVIMSWTLTQPEGLLLVLLGSLAFPARCYKHVSIYYEQIVFMITNLQHWTSLQDFVSGSSFPLIAFIGLRVYRLISTYTLQDEMIRRFLGYEKDNVRDWIYVTLLTLGKVSDTARSQVNKKKALYLREEILDKIQR